uniref:Uncharacterized protein n=1 Tax=Anguilla anguilla TaxID=7936 RepID=A0A0E9X1I3_ANGAN
MHALLVQFCCCTQWELPVRYKLFAQLCLGDFSWINTERLKRLSNECQPCLLSHPSVSRQLFTLTTELNIATGRMNVIYSMIS